MTSRVLACASVLSGLALVAGCSSSSLSPEAGAPDARPHDGSAGDARTEDAPHDAAPADAHDAAADSGADAADSVADASDSSADASDSGPTLGDGGPVAAGTWTCAPCNGATCDAGCGAGSLLCGAACVPAVVDANNCGACGHACAAGELCSRGVCTPRSATVLASGISGASHVSLDAKSVYWVDAAGVHFVPRAGGAVKDLAPAAGKPVRVALDATTAYWSEPGAGAIMRAPKDGTGAPALVTAATQPQGLVIVGGTLYWVSSKAGDASIHQIPATGGTASVFYTVDASASAPALMDIAAGGTTLAVSEGSLGGPVMGIPILADGTAGTPTVLVTSPSWTHASGAVAARPGDFCYVFAGSPGQWGFQCLSGIAFTPVGQGTPFTLPACGLAYSGGAIDVIARRDFNPSVPFAPSPVLKLSSDTAVAMTSDDADVCFINTAGELRLLAMP